MIHVLSKILGRKKSGNNESSPNVTNTPSPKNQTIWQKATSLRQSLRQSSRSKVVQKSGFEFSNLSSGEKSATLEGSNSGNKVQENSLRREWRSQRNLARERRSLATKAATNDELAAAKRSLHSRSLCMSGDWDVDNGVPATLPDEQHETLGSKQSRSPRKLTKDSGYETSAQGDHDYANSISDWFSQEKALDEIPDGRSWSQDNHVRNSKNNMNGEKRLEWNTRNRPLSFSHQEVASERARNRQLRHSYSQREVSRPSRQPSIDSLSNSSKDIKQLTASVESVSTWSNCPTITKSTPHLAQGRSQRLSTSSTGSLLQSEPDEAAGCNMVTRRFKKGSVYDALASTSGLDFSPVVQLKTYNRRDDTGSTQGSKPSDKLWENSTKFQRKSPSKDNDVMFCKGKPKQDPSDAPDDSLHSPVSSIVSHHQGNKPSHSFPANSKAEGNDAAKCIAAHEKYPSEPLKIYTGPTSAVSLRSHSWTGQTDYPKEKVVYSRPKKANQFKISTNQLQPVLERAPDYQNKNVIENTHSAQEQNSPAKNYNGEYPNCGALFSPPAKCNAKQFDFEAFHTPCIPQCFDEKGYTHKIHSPPERDISSSSVSGAHEPQRSMDVPKGISTGPHDTPFLDRLRLDNALHTHMPHPPLPMIPAAQQIQELGNFDILRRNLDFDDNGTWMGSIDSTQHTHSSNGRGVPKWQNSNSDLSTFSTELSNRSSLFDSGHSTMPESGRLSPEYISSCDSTATSLLLEGPTRAEVVARHGCHREIVAHSARVQQPQRHGSESVLYYATGPSRINPDNKSGSSTKNREVDAGSLSQLSPEDAMYRSHASVTLCPSSKSKLHEVPDNQNKPNKCPREDSRKSSFSSEDSYPRSRSHCGARDDTSISLSGSSDISNTTCISSKGTESKSLNQQSAVREIAKSTHTITEPPFSKLKTAYEPPKSKSMDETTRKFVFPESNKRLRISDPDLKQIQKQAVMSYFQRMSMSESVKAENNSPGQQTEASEMEPPPPYEATPNSRINMYSLSLAPKKLSNQWEKRNPNLPHTPSKPPDTHSGLNHHSKSVPNLAVLKGQNKQLGLKNIPQPSQNTHQIFKRPYDGSAGCNARERERESGIRFFPKEREEISEKKLRAIEKIAALSSENRDPPEDNGGCSSGMHYFKSHKSPRKVQLKEVHHSNETASVKVMTPDGVTLVQTHEQRRDDKHGAAPIPPHKRRPAPPPPPKQPPKRPPPPPPPVTPPPEVVVVVNGNDTDNVESKIGELMIDVPSAQLSTSASSPQLGCAAPALQPPSSSCCGGDCPSSPDLPLPPPPESEGNEIMISSNDEPLPPPPADMNVQQRILDSSSLIYPKNSYMSYRSERKLGRQGFDGKYRRSFHTSASSVDLTTLGSSFLDGKDGFCPNNWEQQHNIRQPISTNIIFHSDSLQHENRLQRSSSQDCVLTEEQAPYETDNISNSKLVQESEGNQSSISINSQCSNDQGGVPSQSVPYSPASHERNALEKTENSFFVDSHPHPNNFTKVASSQSSNNAVENYDTTNDDSSSLDNSILTDESFVESDTSCFTNVDHNQNAVKNSEDISRIINGSDLNRINSAPQTIYTDTPRLQRKFPKTREELECEQLSIDFVNRCGDTSLKNLLIPSSNRKTMSHYMEGLLNTELETSGHPVQRHHIVNSTSKNENRQKEEKWSNNEKNTNSLFSKMKIDHCKEMNDNQSDEESDLKKRKEQLILSIEKKVDTLRNEQTNIREEMLQNDLLGQEIASSLQKVAKPNELEKYSLHVEEMEKIVNLLLSLSGRLARAENILKNMPKESSEEKKILEAKREKLREQHEDARRLKESIDRRNHQVSTFLHRYFSEDEYAEYDHFIKMKTKLIVDIREIDEKINLGEEQLAALSVVAHLWKSANS